MRPDYAGGSLVNLVASIAAARGGRARHAPLADFAIDERVRNIVLLIIDGLGDNYLGRCGAGSELARRRRRSLTSVFPSTTASAITTSYTGCTPLEHGLTGWFTYFGEAGCVSAALPFRSRGDMALLSARGVTPEQIYTVPSLFGAIIEVTREFFVKENDEIAGAGAVFRPAKTKDIDADLPCDGFRRTTECCDRIGEACAVHVDEQRTLTREGRNPRKLITCVNGAEFRRLRNADRARFG